MAGYTQKEFEKVVKHATDNLNFVRNPKGQLIHATYFGGSLEIFRDTHDKNDKAIVLDGLVYRVFRDEPVQHICRVLDDAKLEADEIFQNFKELLAQVMEHVSVEGITLRWDHPAESPDAAYLYHEQIGLFHITAEPKGEFSFRVNQKGARHTKFDSIPKLKLAAKRAVTKHIKDLKNA